MKDIAQIREELSKLRQVTFRFYQLKVGIFTLSIFTSGIQDTSGLENPKDSIMNYDVVDVTVMEWKKTGAGQSIKLIEDPRFKGYEPIMYNVINSPGGRINMSNGHDMPIHYLCELIRYLDRLSNLTVFM